MKLYSRIWFFFCITMINEKFSLLQILQEDLSKEIDFNDNYQYKKKITFFSINHFKSTVQTYMYVSCNFHVGGFLSFLFFLILN